jgi:predicted acyltransferase
MILGLIAGAWMKRAADGSPPPPESTGVNPEKKAQDTPAMAATLRLIYAGFICLALGWALHMTGLCPVVKRIWTPAWTLFSGGWCFLILAGFYFITEVQGWKRWSFPLIVIGMNSIAMYVLVHTVTDFLRETLHTHLGRDVFKVLGEALVPVLEGGTVLLILWLTLFWMHRRKLYLRI